MDVHLEVRPEVRSTDRVSVCVRVVPDAAGARVDAVLLVLAEADGRPLGARALLPVPSVLDGPWTLRVELRADQPLPDSALVVGTVWQGAESERLSVPAVAPTTLREFVRGPRDAVPDAAEVTLGPASEAQCARLRDAFPWLDAPVRAGADAAVLEVRDDVPSAEDLAETLDLGADEAAWLRDLLADDEV